MTKKITVEMHNQHGSPFAIDHPVDERAAHLMRDPTSTVTIRIGFESITMRKVELAKLFEAVSIAADTSASYPEDWARFYGLGEQGDAQ